jgi:phosphinothricin acetyltransferase
VIIRPARKEDAAAIAEIYSYYIKNTVITFEEQSVNADDMLQRISETQDQKLPYLVAIDTNDKVRGYAYASSWKGRCAYRFSVEVTVYLSHDASGHGLGSLLYEQLFSELKAASYHVVIAGISLPNPVSVALHEKFGMRKVAHFDEVGFKFGQWVDVGYWQCELE